MCLSPTSFFFKNMPYLRFLFFFFFNDPAPTEIYPLPLPAALPICAHSRGRCHRDVGARRRRRGYDRAVRRARRDTRIVAIRAAGAAIRVAGAVIRAAGDRKSTRLNSSHLVISYAVFCLKKKKYNNS